MRFFEALFVFSEDATLARAGRVLFVVAVGIALPVRGRAGSARESLLSSPGRVISGRCVVDRLFALSAPARWCLHRAGAVGDTKLGGRRHLDHVVLENPGKPRTAVSAMSVSSRSSTSDGTHRSCRHALREPGALAVLGHCSLLHLERLCALGADLGLLDGTLDGGRLKLGLLGG